METGLQAARIGSCWEATTVILVRNTSKWYQKRWRPRTRCTACSGNQLDRGTPQIWELREKRKRNTISWSRAGMRWHRKNALAGGKDQSKRAAAEVELSTGSWDAEVWGSREGLR